MGNIAFLSFCLILTAVKGFTISRLFAGLQSDVTTLQQYKGPLINKNPDSTTQITNIFARYHYEYPRIDGEPSAAIFILIVTVLYFLTKGFKKRKILPV